MSGGGNELSVLGKEKTPSVTGIEHMVGRMEGIRLLTEAGARSQRPLNAGLASHLQIQFSLSCSATLGLQTILLLCQLGLGFVTRRGSGESGRQGEGKGSYSCLFACSSHHGHLSNDNAASHGGISCSLQILTGSSDSSSSTLPSLFSIKVGATSCGSLTLVFPPPLS